MGIAKGLKIYDEFLNILISRIDKSITKVLSIYQFGSISTPGISDIDLMVVFKNEAEKKDFFEVNKILDSIVSDFPRFRNIVVHAPFYLPENLFKEFFSHFYITELKHIYGKELNYEIHLNDIEKILISVEATLSKLIQALLAYISKRIDLKWVLLRSYSLKHSVNLIKKFVDVSEFESIKITSELRDMYNKGINIFDEHCSYAKDPFLSNLINRSIKDFIKVLNLGIHAISSQILEYEMIGTDQMYAYSSHVLLIPEFKNRNEYGNFKVMVENSRIIFPINPRLFTLIKIYSSHFSSMNKRFIKKSNIEYGLKKDFAHIFKKIVYNRAKYMKKVWAWNTKIVGSPLMNMTFMPFGYCSV